MTQASEQRNAQRRKQRAQRKALAAEASCLELATPLECLDWLTEAASDGTPAAAALIDAAEATVRAALEEREEQRPKGMGTIVITLPARERYLR